MRISLKWLFCKTTGMMWHLQFRLVVRRSQWYFQPDLSNEVGALMITDVQPHILKAKVSKRDADNPSYKQAMNSPEADRWFEAMEVEMKTLEQDFKAWELEPQESRMKVLPSIWAFKLKRYSDGLAKKFKARFCICGDVQEQGVDFFETWSPTGDENWPKKLPLLAAVY
jgi:hypothetical protein